MYANAIAIAALLVAGAALWLVVTESRANRRHHRSAVRPILEFELQRRRTGVTGLLLQNRGVGPAIVTESQATLDGKVLGAWDEAALRTLAGALPIEPWARPIRTGTVIPPGFSEFVLYLPDFEPARDWWFWQLLQHRFRMILTYDSLYGGDGYRTASERGYDPVPRPAGEATPQLEPS
jgi:hypothetical protein